MLGLDVGQSRIGVAISDAERKVAVPHGTVRTGAPEDVKAIRAIVEENGVTEIVVGLPLTLAGAREEAAAHSDRFADVLRQVVGVPVVLQDERLTTVQAERSLASAGVKGPARRQVVDQSAATFILQSYLDSHR